MILRSAQVRMARAALNCTLEELAAESGVSVKTLRKLEKDGPSPNVSLRTHQRVAESFRRGGLIFLPNEDSLGFGVRFALPK
jgi:transcriptional regulator with XRE-family HTH domain